MLLGFNTVLARRLFAKVQKPADLAAKLGKLTVRMGRKTAHEYIVSRYVFRYRSLAHKRNDLLALVHLLGRPHDQPTRRPQQVKNGDKTQCVS